jgi:hypothetical protein
VGANDRRRAGHTSCLTNIVTKAGPLDQDWTCVDAHRYAISHGMAAKQRGPPITVREDATRERASRSEADVHWCVLARHSIR